MNFVPDTTYSFEIYGSGIITTDFSMSKVVGIVNSRIARNYSDIDALQVQVRPHLPANSPRDQDRYTYLIVEFPTKHQTAVAVEWIKQDTIREISGIGVRITTEKNLSTDDVERIRVMLATAGIAANIETVV